VHFSGFSSAFLPLPALSHTVTHSFTTNTDTHTHAWHSEEMKMQTDEKEERVKVKCNGLLKAAMTFSFKLCTSLELPRRHAPRPYTPLHTHIDAKKKSQRILQISPRSSSRTSCPTTHSFLTFCQRTSHSYGNGNFCLRFLRHCLQCRFGFGSPDSD